VPQQSGVPSLTSPSTDQSVKLEVLALDQNYQPVTDMKPEDFRLTQNKQDVKINSAQFKASGMLNFALVFDLSGSRRDDRRFREEFAETSDFLRRMWQAGDMATVVAFNDLPHTVISATQNLDAAVRGLDSLAHVAPRGSTALYDVICSVAMDQNSASPSRKVVLIFSDFDDDSSRNTAQQGIECAWKGKMSIYPFIIINEHSEQKETSHDLKTASAFSEQSGGVAFNTKSASELSESLSQLTQFLHSSYEITFTPPPAKPGENPVPIDVETTRPGVKLYSARRYYDQ
jgi:Ca-activated chloride channel family protein